MPADAKCEMASRRAKDCQNAAPSPGSGESGFGCFGGGAGFAFALAAGFVVFGDDADDALASVFGFDFVGGADDALALMFGMMFFGVAGPESVVRVAVRVGT
mmetsp:Transcript_25798/g.63784  ORF Transcript_25798/g.63784 Transcript_25798/m.63784 type:complete len:102 (+) Transcript_25798:37-342(+)